MKHYVRYYNFNHTVTIGIFDSYISAADHLNAAAKAAYEYFETHRTFEDNKDPFIEQFEIEGENPILIRTNGIATRIYWIDSFAE